MDARTKPIQKDIYGPSNPSHRFRRPLAFWPGKGNLLEAIDTHGSIRKAATSLGMSARYRKVQSKAAKAAAAELRALDRMVR